MGEYDRAIATAKRLIEKKGQTVQWRKNTGEAGSEPWKSQRPAAGTLPEVKIVFFPPDEGSRRTLQQITGVELPRADEYGLMAAVPFSPQAGDAVLRAGIGSAVVGVSPLAPGGDVVLYTLWFSR